MWFVLLAFILSHHELLVTRKLNNAMNFFDITCSNKQSSGLLQFSDESPMATGLENRLKILITKTDQSSLAIRKVFFVVIPTLYDRGGTDFKSILYFSQAITEVGL